VLAPEHPDGLVLVVDPVARAGAVGRDGERHGVRTSFAISGGEPSRSGGPQYPVPRET
jgi:hypothetical protein